VDEVVRPVARLSGEKTPPSGVWKSTCGWARRYRDMAEVPHLDAPMSMKLG
jgi:hypothetical protein